MFRPILAILLKLTISKPSVPSHLFDWYWVFELQTFLEEKELIGSNCFMN